MNTEQTPQRNTRSRARSFLFALRALAVVLDASIASLTLPYFVDLGTDRAFHVIRYFAVESATGEGMSDELFAATVIALFISAAIGVLGWFLGSALFLSVSEWLTGGTPGKHLVGLKVVTRTDERPSLFRAWARQSGKLFSGAFFGIGFLMPLWTRHAQALHDKMARCRVVPFGKRSVARLLASACCSLALLAAVAPPTYERVRIVVETSGRILQSVRSPGPVQILGWAMVRKGLDELHTTWERENQPERSN